MIVKSRQSPKKKRYAVPKNYAEDIVPGLRCQRKCGKDGHPYLVFLDENGHIKWWIVPDAYNQFHLYHANKYGKHGKHSQGETGKPHELIEYIRQHEEYERS
jgi:hypothetical protein